MCSYLSTSSTSPIGGGDASPFGIYPASQSSVEGEAPSGFAGGGGDA
ncbi:MAG: hypothetical protein HZA13_02860, partial [Nitrospirae bacterium]|nr:hypothetical protein [Nitrospirota bacterium]